ncbi:MAG: cobalt ECF transporter T component CbiQ [Acetivibrionales bacterium]|jgi:cobalt/nickel transport system permease protein
MLNIDKRAYCSRLIGVNPFEKLLFSFLTMVVCLAADSIVVSVLTIILMSGVSILKGGVPWRVYTKAMLVPFAFLIIGVVTIALNVSDEPWNLLWGVSISGVTVGVTASSLYSAANLFFKALGAVSCLYFLSLNTPMLDIVSVLRKLKVPEILLELMSLVYRFIFVLMETAECIYTSQASRLGYSSVISGYRSLGQLISTLFICSYKRSQDLYTALEARCYSGRLSVMEMDYAVSYKNIVFIIMVNIMLIAAAVFTGGLL